jgi:hypothetical protein
MLNTFTIDRGDYWMPGLDPCFQDPRVMPSSNPWIAIQTLGATIDQSFHRLDELASVTERLQGIENKYISQAFFNRASRRKIYVELIDHAWVDLDVYSKTSRFSSAHILNDPKAMAEEVVGYCLGNAIPEPTSVWSSGRGLYAKWAYSTPLPGRAIPRVEALNRKLAELLRSFGADSAVAHAASVLRLPGSLNSKNGGAVRKLWQNSHHQLPYSYDFSELCDEVLTYTQDEVRDFRRLAEARPDPARDVKIRRSDQRAVDWSAWNWGVFCDIQRLISIRGHVEEGQRDHYAFVAAVHLAHCVRADQLRAELSAFCGDLVGDQSWTDQKFIQGFDNTLVERAWQSARGNKILYDGKNVDPRYRFKKTTLIELLNIEPDEMKHMQCLIDLSEKSSRAKAKRVAVAAQKTAAKYAALRLYEQTGDRSGHSARTLQNWRKTL